MFFEEKIELFKKKYAQNEFSIPFINSIKILKRIESSFIIKPHSNGMQNWEKNLKNIVFVKKDTINIRNELSCLEPNTNYWIVLTLGSAPATQKFLIKCVGKLIIEVISLTNETFFVVEQKLDWLLCFKKSLSGYEIIKCKKVTQANKL